VYGGGVLGGGWRRGGGWVFPLRKTLCIKKYYKERQRRNHEQYHIEHKVLKRVDVLNIPVVQYLVELNCSYCQVWSRVPANPL
jgi:hypothetical protein